MTCASCNGRLPDAARFCPACGHPVTAATAERRVVTVVFADLAGFTELSEGRDPEAVKALLDGCFASLVPVIEDHGGCVDKIIGDELMAVFGAPLAHEDDPERAVRAGVALLETLGDLDVELEMRVGINTGEVLAGPVGPAGAYTVTGDAVNTAHRLVSVAEPGEVLVAEPTWAATLDAVVYGPTRSHRLRGKRGAVKARAALATRRAPGPQPEPTTGLNDLVGRTTELAALTEMLCGPAPGARSRPPRPGLVVLVGEPGIGKTHLLAAVTRQVAQRSPSTRVLWTRAVPYGAEPLEPVADMVRAVLGLPAGHTPTLVDLDGRTRPLATRSGAAPALLASRIAQLLGAHHAPDRPTAASPARPRVVDELLGAARTVIEACTADGPVVVILDDAHWVESLVLDPVLRAAAWRHDLPITMVVAGRDELLERLPDVPDDHRAERRTIRLGPIAEAEARLILHHALARLPGAPDVTGGLGPAAEQKLLDAAGGNPLLTEQLAAFLAESGAITPSDEGWRVVRPLDELGLPDGARALLRARIDSLPNGARVAIQAASVIGRGVDAASLEVVGVSCAGEALAELERRGLLVPESTTGRWGFRHLLVRDAAYAALPIAERAAMHAALGRWLSEHPDPTDDAGTVAHHYERAVMLNRELDRTDPRLEAAAAGHLVLAGREALARDDLRGADRWLGRARILGIDDQVEARTVAMAHGDALAGLRRLDEAREAYEEVLQRTTGSGAPGAATPCPELAADAHARLGMVARLTGDAAAAAVHFEEATARWQGLADPVGEARVHRQAGWAELIAGRPRSALPKLLLALDLCAEGPDGSQAGQDRGVTLQCVGWCEFLVGDLEASRAHLIEAADVLARHGERAELGWCFGLLGYSLWQEGRIEQARSVATSLQTLAATQGDPWSEGMCTVLLGVCTLEAGEVEVARSVGADAVRVFGEMDDPWGEAMARLVQGMAARVAGDLEGAERLLRRGIATAHRVGSVGEEARLRAELGATLLDAGSAGAEDEARRTLTLVRSGSGDRDSEIRALVVLAKLEIARGEPSRARVLLEEAMGLGGGPVTTSVWRRACALLSMVEAEAGDPDEAHRLAGLAATGSWESARTWVLAQRAIAAAHVSSGNQASALAALDAVARRFNRRGLAFVEPARQELRALAAAPEATRGPL